VGGFPFSTIAPKMVQSMVSKLWPLLLVLLSPVPGSARMERAPLRISRVQVPLAVHERQVWISVVRDSRFAAVPHSSTRAGCQAASAPEPLATPNPLLDVADLTISISVSFIVGTDGHVHSPFILESAGALPDRKVLNAVRSWRYRPALCNGVPAEAEGNIEFSSR
jgi:TonB family protein